MSAARDADARQAAGHELGPLHGIPFGIKDIIATSDGPTTAQSVILSSQWGGSDAPSVARIRNAGGIVMGTTTTMEFAIGLPAPESPFPLPRNPWQLDRYAGGSSSGSASGVATGALLGALGTDSAGSIRAPAAFCGVTGLKPTYGRVPKSGCVPLGFSVDGVGPIARTGRDCGIILNVIAGHHPSDPTSVNLPVPDYLAGMTGDLTGVRIGVDRLTRMAGDAADTALDGVLDGVLSVFRSLGAVIVDIELPLYHEMVTANTVVMLSEALSFHLPDLRSQWNRYGSTTRSVLACGAFYTAADYVQAHRVRHAGQRAIAKMFGDLDAIVTPTCATGAVSFEDLDAVAKDASEGFKQIYTAYWNSVGNPVVSMPVGFSHDGLPLGLQIAARPFEEEMALKIVDSYQQATDWHLQTPPLLAIA